MPPQSPLPRPRRPASSVRRSNFETIGPPFPRTQRTPRRFAGDVSAQWSPTWGRYRCPPCAPTGICLAFPPGWAGAPRPPGRPTSATWAPSPAWMSRSDVESPEGVDRMHLRRYLASLGTRKLARATIARKAAALRCYFSWLVRQGRLGSDPTRTLRAPSGGGRLPRVLSGGEVTSLLDVGGGDGGGPAGPGRARAALRGRAAGVGAVRSRPGRHRPARPHRDRAGQGRQAAPRPDPRRRRGRAAGLVRTRAGPDGRARPRRPS